MLILTMTIGDCLYEIIRSKEFTKYTYINLLLFFSRHIIDTSRLDNFGTLYEQFTTVSVFFFSSY